MAKILRGIDQLAPVESTNLHQRVYAQLREAIMSGKFRPGEVLTLRSLAAALGTSIMPARDAVLKLVVERALETRGRSVQVPVLTIDQLRDIERVRVVLEGEAAAMAAERRSAEELDEIETANEIMEKARLAGRVDKYLAANQQFHFAVYRASHNDLVRSIIETLWLQIGPHLAFVAESAEDLLTEVNEQTHRRLIAAIKRRDSEAARKALAADLKDSTDIYKPFTEVAKQQADALVKRRRAQAS